MFPFQVSSSYFDLEISIQHNFSSSSASTGFASTYSDSDSSVSSISSSAYDFTVSSNVICHEVLMTARSDCQSSLSPIKKLVQKSPTCYYDPSTCQYQRFSIPDKIVYYIAKNPTNGNTFRKLVQTCKYFYKINPVIVVQQLECYRYEWYARYDVDGEYRVEFKYDPPMNFKIWVTEKFVRFFGNVPQLIPSIYKNDATVVDLRGEPLKLEDFLFIAGNAEQLSLSNQLIKYKNGEVVQFEDIVENILKLKYLYYEPHFDGEDVNSNTVRKVMEIEHFKHLSHLILNNVSEDLDVEEMFHYICENKDVFVYLCYRYGISHAYKERVREYANLLRNENGCKSRIRFNRMEYGTLDEFPSSEDDSTDTYFENFDDVSDVDENEDLMFPWNNEDEEEWELPWDKTE